MLRLLAPSLAMTVSLVLAAAVQAAENVTEFFLDNGMQVVVIEDHRSPAVVHMVWYRAGAADEPPGRSGVAHFLEHLMFKGTDDVESGAFSRIVESNGGTDNAFTSWDYTGYFQRVAADRLGLLMELEADRMRDLRFADEEVVTERSVILEERAERVDSSAGGLFNEQMRAVLFNNHPYAIPIIGWRHEMEQLDREALIDFYDAHYWPNNAVLIVAGDVTPGEVRSLAETHYGQIPANPDIAPRARPQEPPQIADRRVVYEDERVANPYVARAYPVPAREPGDQRRAAALTMLAEILGGSGQTSVLGRQLQVEEERALYAAAFYDSTSYDPSSFNLVNVPVPGVSLQEAEADLDRVIAQFLEDGIDPAQFERIKFQIEAAQIYEEDNVQGLARSYGVALTSGLTVEDVDAWPDVLAAVTVDEVMEEARLLFNETRSVTGYLMQPTAEEVTQ
jgi:zinc protease